MKQFEIKTKVSWIERENNSYCGNPRWSLCIFVDGHLRPNIAKTQTNAPIGYQCCYNWEGKEKTFLAHWTRSGNLVLDKLIGE